MVTVGVHPDKKRLDKAVENGSYDPLLLALSQQQTGQWSSDHRREASLLRGWNYIGITPICKMAASATVSIRDASAKSNRAEDTDRGAPLPQKHPLYRLVTQPNPWMTGAMYRWEVVQQLHLHGTAIVWRCRDENGFTKYRIPIPMAITEPLRAGDFEEAPAGGIRVRPIDTLHGSLLGLEAMYSALKFAAGRVIGIDDLILYRYPHPFLRGDGHSPTSAAGAWVELIEAVDNARSEQMDRGALPKILVTPPKEANASASELEAYQSRLNQRMRSTDDSVVAVPHGTATVASFNPDEMGYSQAFDQLGPAVMAAHGTSKAAAGLQDDMTYGGLSASMDAFNIIATQPDLDIMADEDTATIAAEYGPNITIAYKAPEVKNPEHEETKNQNDVLSGTLTVGEYRVRRGLQPFGDERDDLPAGGEAIKNWRPGGAKAPAAAVTADPANPFARFMGGQQKAMRPKLKDMAPAQPIPTDGPNPYVVAIDLDGTLAEYDGNYTPGVIGPPRAKAAEAVRVLMDAGCVIVIYTVRNEDAVVEAWLRSNGIPFDAINENPLFEKTGGKMAADVYWDDLAVGVEGPMTQQLLEIAERIGDKEITERIIRKTTQPAFSKDHGFLFIPIEGAVAAKVRSISSDIDEIVEKEGEPHLTLIPFVISADPEEVVRLLRPAGTFHIKIGDLAVFPANDDRVTDCLHLQIDSRELDYVYQAAADNLPHVQAYDSWQPHVTAGYVTAGSGEKYAGPVAGLSGTAYPVTKIVYRPPYGKDVVIPLRKQPSMPT